LEPSFAVTDATDPVTFAETLVFVPYEADAFADPVAAPAVTVKPPELAVD
jgi:hypothetical protein